GVVRWLYGNDELISLDLNVSDQCSQRRAIKPDLLVIDFSPGLVISEMLLENRDDRLAGTIGGASGLGNGAGQHRSRRQQRFEPLGQQLHRASAGGGVPAYLSGPGARAFALQGA